MQNQMEQSSSGPFTVLQESDSHVPLLSTATEVGVHQKSITISKNEISIPLSDNAHQENVCVFSSMSTESSDQRKTGKIRPRSKTIIQLVILTVGTITITLSMFIQSPDVTSTIANNTRNMLENVL